MNKRFYTYIFLISFFLFPLIIIGQSQKLVRQGKKITDPKQKIEIFTKAIEVDDKNLDAYFYRGLAKYDLQNYWSSILDFTKIIFSKPDADTFYNRGNAKYALGDFEGAYEDYVMAIQYNRDFFQAYYNLGMAQFNLHKYKQAVQSFIFLLKYFPDDVNTNIQLGLSLTELKQKELAILFLNKSISLEPNSDTYHNRGIAYLNMKDFKKAAADFKKAINLDKTNDSAYFYLGIAQLFDRNYTAAVKSFEDTLSFNSIDHETLVALAVANYHSENYDKAKHCFKKAKNILAAENEFHKYKNDISLFKETSWSIDEGYIFESYVERLNSL
ncbi:tetratricopeptide repeat protein [Hyunsoonleella pacifica]|uniref:Tetratricopeptide repeat protein n=1 Tax=Hyunsoonleella pacifica TaxID=1080224 RepID=A0A4Q9FM95_9FLAO|nr:tetratricopeptide repeat protein [Hyunsoonleella pacifica]TBN15532.1 tetratricopeptide repeat protein [Hyunsoonleella pacifica]